MREKTQMLLNRLTLYHYHRNKFLKNGCTFELAEVADEHAGHLQNALDEWFDERIEPIMRALADVTRAVDSRPVESGPMLPGTDE